MKRPAGSEACHAVAKRPASNDLCGAQRLVCSMCGEPCVQYLSLGVEKIACVRRSANGNFFEGCCAETAWVPADHCCVRAPQGAHCAGAGVIFEEPGRWRCRAHRDFGNAESWGGHVPLGVRARFPPHPRLRLVGGLSGGFLHFGEGAAANFPDFLLELVRAHSLRRAKAPQPWTNDCILHAAWFECPLDEWDKTSELVARSLRGLAEGNSERGPLLLLRQGLLAISVARFFGGREWIVAAIEAVVESPALVTGLSAEALTLRMRRLLEEVIVGRGVNPFTEAHRPQRRYFRIIGKLLRDGQRQEAFNRCCAYWQGAKRSAEEGADSGSSDGGDEEEPDGQPDHSLTRWDVLFALSDAIANSIMARERGGRSSCYWCAQYATKVPHWGATQLVLKTIVRDLCRYAVAHDLAPLPEDYHDWGPSGPGSRRCSLRLRLAAKDAANMSPKRKKMIERDVFRPVASPAGRAFEEMLTEQHKLVLSSPVLPTLEALAGHPWGRHDTQGGQCVYYKYLCIRAAMLDRRFRWPSSVRWHEKNLENWSEK